MSDSYPIVIASRTPPPEPGMHHKQAKLLHKALRVYTNSKDGKWTRIAASKRRASLHTRSYRIRREQAEVWGRFGQVELQIRLLPWKRDSKNNRGMFVLYARYPEVGTWPSPEVEREVVQELRDSGLEVIDTSTPQEWARYAEAEALREQVRQAAALGGMT